MSQLLKSLTTINRTIGQAVAYLALVMALITLTIVILRYGFSIGSIALQESVMYMHAVLFMLGLGYTMQSDGHVRVDILYSRTSPNTQRWINLAGHLLFLMPLAVLLIVYSWDFVLASWRVREASPEVGGIPGIFLLKSLIPISAALLLLEAVIESLKTLLEVRQLRA